MPRGWSGADPVSLFGADGTQALGTEQRANADVTLTKIWIYAQSSVPVSGRTAKIWNPATQAILATVALPDQLPDGWSGYDIPTPIVRPSGTRWLVSYQPTNYAATSHALDSDVNSFDGAVTNLGTSNATNGNGVFSIITNGFPHDSFNATWYGVDVEYELGQGEEHPPVIEDVSVGTDGLTATLVIDASDPDGETLTYAVDWGDGQTTSGTAAIVAHMYAAAGTYGALVKVTDPGGLSAYRAIAITVVAPVPLVGDPVVMPLAKELLACYEQELAKLGDRAPAYIGMRPGTTVDFLLSTSEDECCAGLAWVRPAQFYPSSAAFPTQDEVAQKQGTRAWAVILEMGIVRCSPTPDENSIPSNDEWMEVTQGVMDATAAMRRAICCWIDMDPATRKQKILPGQWQPVAVQGGCVGGVLQVTIMGPACDCTDAGLTSS